MPRRTGGFPPLTRRLLGAVATVLALAAAVLPVVAALPSPAAATEAGSGEREPLPSIDEIGTQAGREFFPDEYEEPKFFRFIYGPLAAVGILLIMLVLVRYLIWQPRFTAERRERKKR